MMARFLIYALFVFAGCSTELPVYDRGALFDLIIWASPKYPGKLINQNCVKYEKDACVQFDVMQFDLADEAQRKSLWDQMFMCNVGGQRYAICKTKPGLCMNGERIKKFIGIVVSRDIIEVDYIPLKEGFQFLADSNTICAAKNSLIGREEF